MEILSISGGQLQEKVQRWLSPPDPSVNQNIAREAYHSGTATWFIQSSVYNEWKAKGSVLWIHGKRTSRRSFYSVIVYELLSRSGIWEERPVVRGPVVSVDIAHIGGQLFNHKGCPRYMRDRLGFTRILLLRFQGRWKARLPWFTYLSHHPALRSIPS